MQLSRGVSVNSHVQHIPALSPNIQQCVLPWLCPRVRSLHAFDERRGKEGGDGMERRWGKIYQKSGAELRAHQEQNAARQLQEDSRAQKVDIELLCKADGMYSHLHAYDNKTADCRTWGFACGREWSMIKPDCLVDARVQKKQENQYAGEGRDWGGAWRRRWEGTYLGHIDLSTSQGT